MIDPLTFFKGLGVAILMVLLASGLFYWIYIGLKKFNKRARYFVKYKILKAKHNQEMVEMLLADIQNNVDEKEMWTVLLKKGVKQNKLYEIQYVHSELKKLLKGGKK